MSVILVEMATRKAKHIRPEDVAAAVIKHGADEVRRDLVRLMAEAWNGSPYRPADGDSWMNLAWVCEETARSLPA